MTCAYATWDGSYVLGALSPTDRAVFERHLADCSGCAAAVRDLAGLPGLLSRVDERDLVTPAGPAPQTLLPRLVREVRGARRRRRLVAAGLAAATVLVAGTGAVVAATLTGPEPPGGAPPPVGTPAGTSSAVAARPMQPLGGSAVRGWLTLETVPWGTRLTLECTYGSASERYGAGQPVDYVMVVRTRDGAEQEVATWNAVPGRSLRLTAATATGRADIATVEVRTGEGRPVLRIRG